MAQAPGEAGAVLAARRERPEALTRTLREIGQGWQADIRGSSDRTKELYLPLLRQADEQGLRVIRDLPYGEHPLQRLDLHLPMQPRHAPVVIFVHGGAFVRGARTINDRMYGNVLGWFARRGLIGVNVGYRLAPESVYPGGARDVALACEWIVRHIAEHGGDANRLCLIGHSAGGTHAATYAYDPAAGFTGRHLRHLVLISARLRADTLPENPNAEGVRAYFGDDASLYDARSPLTHAATSTLPVMIVNAEFENPLLDLYGLELALVLARHHRRAPPHLTVADHNHMSIVAHFGTSEQWLGEQILGFIETRA